MHWSTDLPRKSSASMRRIWGRTYRSLQVYQTWVVTPSSSVSIMTPLILRWMLTYRWLSLHQVYQVCYVARLCQVYHKQLYILDCQYTCILNCAYMYLCIHMYCLRVIMAGWFLFFISPLKILNIHLYKCVYDIWILCTCIVIRSVCILHAIESEMEYTDIVYININ